jgi:hypothetical protein
MSDSTATKQDQQIENIARPIEGGEDVEQAPVDTSEKVRQNQDSPAKTATENIKEKPTSLNMPKQNIKILAAMSIVAILAGIGTGYGGFKLQTQAGGGSANVGGSGDGEIQQVAKEGSINVGDVFGLDDVDTFKDSAEGYLELGGLDGEGSHKLLRPGGISQTVYLTSSVTDLDKFDGMEVNIAGETFKGQKAGWLMDVGRVEVVNLTGTAPETE